MITSLNLCWTEWGGDAFGVRNLYFFFINNVCPLLSPFLPPPEMMFSWSLVPLRWVPRHCASRLTSLNQSNRVRPASIHRARTRQNSTHSSEGVTDLIWYLWKLNSLELIIDNCYTCNYDDIVKDIWVTVAAKRGPCHFLTPPHTRKWTFMVSQLKYMYVI
jgi:hypothetical protein